MTKCVHCVDGECWCPDCIGSVGRTDLPFVASEVGRCRFCNGTGMVSDELAEKMEASTVHIVSYGAGCRNCDKIEVSHEDMAVRHIC